MSAPADAFFFLSLPLFVVVIPPLLHSQTIDFYFCFLGQKKKRGGNSRDQTAVRYNGYILPVFLLIWYKSDQVPRPSFPVLFPCRIDGLIFIYDPDCLPSSVSSFVTERIESEKKQKQKKQNNRNKNTSRGFIGEGKKDVVSACDESRLHNT